MNKKYIVCKIHNNTLGRVFEAKSEAEAKDFVRGMAEEQLERGLTDFEIDDLNDRLEITNDEDSDNIYSFSIGILE